MNVPSVPRFLDLNGNTLSEQFSALTASRNHIFFNGRRVVRRDFTNNAYANYYFFSDHLGSTSIVTDANGTMASCNGYVSGLFESDYYPYGGEIPICNNLANQNYKFTGKERDAESGLDEFGARYYASALGRFMIPDWAAKPTDVPYANFGNPQSLNLYAYVENNPTTTGDPDGHCPICIVAIVATAEEIAESPEGQELIEEGTEAVEGVAEKYGPEIEQGASTAYNVVKGAVAAGAAYLSSPSGGKSSKPATPPGSANSTEETKDEPEPQAASGGARKGGGSEHTKGARGSTYNRHTGTRSGDKKPPGYKSDRDFKKSKEQKQQEAERRQAEKERKKSWKKTKETKDQ